MAECSACGREIVWASTVQGRPMPVDAERSVGNVVLEWRGVHAWAKVVPDGEGDHVSHWATCPDRERFRHHPGQTRLEL